VAVKTIKAQAHRLPHRNAGYSDTMRALERQPWRPRVDPMVGVAVHEPDAAAPD